MKVIISEIAHCDKIQTKSKQLDSYNLIAQLLYMSAYVIGDLAIIQFKYASYATPRRHVAPRAPNFYDPTKGSSHTLRTLFHYVWRNFFDSFNLGKSLFSSTDNQIGQLRAVSWSTQQDALHQLGSLARR